MAVIGELEMRACGRNKARVLIGGKRRFRYGTSFSGLARARRGRGWSRVSNSGFKVAQVPTSRPAPGLWQQAAIHNLFFYLGFTSPALAGFVSLLSFWFLMERRVVIIHYLTRPKKC